MDIRILIADRQDLFREVLRPLLESEPDFTVIGETGDGEQCVKLAADLKPDVLLFDFNLRRRSGNQLLRDIASLALQMCPILFTDELGKKEVIDALRWGVHGIVSKHEPAHLLIKCIRTTMSGEYWISRSRIRELVQSLCAMASKIEQSTHLHSRNLSQQQLQIVSFIADGCTNKEIAKELSISERTVKYHLTNIFTKLGVAGRTQLARSAFKDNASNLALQ
jgi:two-component system, NarL family, response regulator DegU